MNDDSTAPMDRLRENATEVAVTVVTGLWLSALLTGQGWWLGALLFGYVVVVPLVALLFGDDEDRREWWDDWWSDSDEASSERPAESDTREPRRSDDRRDALETLRDRYAAGELTDAQFERKLDRLLETETLEDAEQWRREAREERTLDPDRDLERET